MGLRRGPTCPPQSPTSAGAAGRGGTTRRPQDTDRYTVRITAQIDWTRPDRAGHSGTSGSETQVDEVPKVGISVSAVLSGSLTNHRLQFAITMLDIADGTESIRVDPDREEFLPDREGHHDW